MAKIIRWQPQDTVKPLTEPAAETRRYGGAGDDPVTASGQNRQSDALDLGDNAFVPWQTGATM